MGLDWGALLSLVLAAFGKAFAATVVGIVQGAKQSSDEQQLGAATTSNATLQDIGEIADAQAENNAMDRGGAGDVARRLRAELAAQPGGDGAGGQGGATRG